MACTPSRFSIAISTTADSKAKIESRVEVVVVNSVMELLREDIVGLVKTREAALEPSDSALEIPSPVGGTATSLFVFRRHSNALIAPLESSSDSSSCSIKGRSVVGLLCCGAILPLPSLPSGSDRKLGMSVSDVVVLCLLMCTRRSAGVFPG